MDACIAYNDLREASIDPWEAIVTSRPAIRSYRDV